MASQLRLRRRSIGQLFLLV